MEKTIEVELRGPLDKKQFTALDSFLKKNAVLTTIEDRYFIDYSTLMKSQGIRKRNIDIRLRSTNKIPEIIIKLGDWSDNRERKELSILGKKGDFDTFVQIFAALGYTKGMQVQTYRKIYRYKGIDFVLVNLFDGFFYIFEAEKMVAAKKDINIAKTQIKKILNELHLKIFTDEEFFGHIEKINKKVAKVFDFKNYTEGYFKKKFKV